MKRTLTVLLATQALIPQTFSFAADRFPAAIQIPVEINYPKHFNVYEAAKSASDKQRSFAELKKSAAESIDREIARLRFQVEEDNSTIITQRNEIARMELENPALRVEISRLKSEIDGLEGELARNNMELGREQTNRENTNSQFLGSRDNYTQTTRSLQVNQDEINQNNSSISQKEARQNQLETQSFNLTARNNELTQKIEDARLQYAQLSSDRELAIANIDRLTPEVDRLRMRADRMGRRIDVKEQNVKKLLAARNFSQEQKELRKEEAKKIHDKIENKEKQLKDALVQLTGMKKRLKEIEKTKREEEAKRNQLATQIVSLTNEIPALETVVRNLGIDVSDISVNKIKPLQADIKTQTAIATAKQAELSALVKEAANDPVVKEKISALQAELDSFNKKIATKSQSIATELATLNGLEEGLKEMELQQSTKTAEKNSAQSDLNKIVSLEKNIKKSKSSISTLSSEISGLENEIASLRQSIAADTAQIANLSGKIKGHLAQAKHFDKKYDEYKKKYRFAIGGSRNKYKKKYREARANRDQQRAAAVTLREQLKPVKARNQQNLTAIDAKSNLKGTKAQEITGLNEKIAEYKEGLGAITKTKGQLQGEINQLVGELGQLSSAIPGAKATIASLNAKLGPVKVQIDRLTVKAKTKQAEINQIVSDPTVVPHLAGQVRTIKAAMAAANSKIESNKGDIEAFKIVLGLKKKEKTKNEKLLAKKKSSKTQKHKELEELKKKVQPRETRLAETVKRVGEKELEIKGFNEILSGLQKKHAEVDQRLREHRRQFRLHTDLLNTAIAELEEMETIHYEQVEGINRSYEELQRNLQVRDELPQIMNELSTFMQQSSNEMGLNQQTLQNNSYELNGVRSELSGLYQSRDSLASFRETNLQVQAQQLLQMNTLKAELDDTDARIEGLRLSAQNLDSQIAGRESTVASHESTISSNITNTAQLRRSNQDLRGQITGNESSIARNGISAEQAWKVFDSENRKALTLETITANKKSIYDNAKRLYQEREQASIDSGSNQGSDLGEIEGGQEGGSLGLNEGKTLGAEIGGTQGELTGYKEGLESGLSQGEREGLEHGRNSEDARTNGYEAGLIEGRNQVYSEAKQKSYPQGRREEKARQLSQRPNQNVELNNTQAGNGGNIGLDDFNESSSELTLRDVNIEWYDYANSGHQGVDGVKVKIKGLSSRLFNLQQKFDDSIVNAGRALMIRPNADFSKVTCSDSYELFVKKCEAAFKKSFETKFTEEYFARYREEYREKMRDNRRESFSLKLEGQREEGRLEAFKVAFHKFDQIGAEEAKNKAYNKGKKDGYNRNKEEAFSIEKSRGTSDEARFFAENPVIRTEKALLTSNESGVYPGSELTLALSALNFGGKESKNGQVRIKVRPATSNVSVLGNDSRALIAVPAETNAAVSNILKVKVSDNVRVGERISLQVSSYLPNGDVKTETVNLKTDRHIEVAEAGLEYEKKPKVKAIGYYNHDVKVTLSNSSRSRLDQNIVLSLTGNSKMIDILKSDLEIDFSSEKEGTVSLQYEFNTKKARKKSHTLTITGTYGKNGRVVFKKDITVKAK
ncbi:MAG: hypothetical protein HN509_00785 [Halobacteriovoraceae bacterium]|nr:hypothetical protein [Halobacteriovoraceae bacterium]MBT5094824.1 hypothetical protein [Halobacteriovoraceae bacterium]